MPTGTQSDVTYRRSLATRIAVTRGTASLSGDGIGPRWTAIAVWTADAVWTVDAVTAAAGLSVDGNGEFRAPFDSGFFGFEESLTAGGFDFVGAPPGALALFPTV